ncbi:hypothetical protein K5D65_22460 [Pseudomonas cichorii]|nr:hypothetical protein [Pseudomonas cichorii]
MKNNGCLLMALVFFVMAWVCLFFAGDGVLENPLNPSDTSGLPTMTLYMVLLQAVSLVALTLSGIGLVVATRFKAGSWWKRVAVFLIFNTGTVLASISGVLIIGAFVLDETLGVFGAFLYLVVIALVISASPKRTHH